MAQQLQMWNLLRLRWQNNKLKKFDWRGRSSIEHALLDRPPKDEPSFYFILFLFIIIIFYRKFDEDKLFKDYI